VCKTLCHYCPGTSQVCRRTGVTPATRHHSMLVPSGAGGRAVGEPPPRVPHRPHLPCPCGHYHQHGTLMLAWLVGGSVVSIARRPAAAARHYHLKLVSYVVATGNGALGGRDGSATDSWDGSGRGSYWHHQSVGGHGGPRCPGPAMPPVHYGPSE
jgi:hypothetical protein